TGRYLKRSRRTALMSEPNETQETEAPKGLMQRFLDVVERVGNRIPHPAIIFLTLIGIVIVLAHVFFLMGVSAPHAALRRHHPRPVDTPLRRVVPLAAPLGDLIPRFAKR